MLHRADAPLDRLGHGHEVGVGLLIDLDLHALLTFDPRDDLALFVRAVGVCHVFEADVHVPFATDDKVRDFGDVLKFVERSDDVFGLALPELSTGEIHIFLSEACVDGGDVQIQRGHLAFVEFDEDLLLQPALDLDRGHAGESLQFPFDLILRDAAEREEVQIAIYAEPHNRIHGRIVAQDQGPFRVLHVEIVELLPDVLGGEIHVRAPLEFQDHVRQPGFGDGVDAYELVDHAQSLLDGPRDGVLHLLGRRARILGAHGQGGVGDVGHEVQGQPLIGYQPEDHDRDHDHQNRHGSRGGHLKQVGEIPFGFFFFGLFQLFRFQAFQIGRFFHGGSCCDSGFGKTAGRHIGLPLHWWSGGRPIGIFPIHFPFQGIIDELFADIVYFAVIADDAFVIIALPESTGKWRPIVVFNTTDICIGGHNLEPLHHMR